MSVRPRRAASLLPYLRAAAGALLLTAGGCAAPPAGAGTPRPGMLYVADERAGTVARLEEPGGRVLGPLLPGVPQATQVVVAPHGAALVLAAPPGSETGSGGGGRLTYVFRAGATWDTRPLPLELGARALLLAGDGGDLAAVVYTAPAAPAAPGPPSTAGERPAPDAPCRVAVVDLRTGAVAADFPACTPRELATGVALERTAGGPVAFLALWRRAGGGEAAGARLVRLAAPSGAPLGEAPANGLPRPAKDGGSLLLAPGLGSGGRPVLYAVEALPDSALATWGAAEYAWQFALSGAWRLRRLTPDGLETEAELPLTFPPSGLSVSPEGDRGYAFDARGDGLVEIDLSGGATRLLARVPGHRPWGLAAGRERVYAASPILGAVLVVDRSSGARWPDLRAGRTPTGIGLAPAGALRPAGA